VKTTKSFLPAIFWCLGGYLVVSVSHAADLKQSKFTQVINDVRVISTADSREKPAVVNAVFNMPDLVRTGISSRAELVAEDKTITRVGANTVFAFDPANRTIDLKRGSLLFHSPKGMGGGTIHTGSATASVLGTTLIVTTTPNGGFKVIDLEGHVAINYLNGLQQRLAPGQMTFVLPGGNPSPVIVIRLDDLTKTSLLVQGFDQPLPSWPLILEQIAEQVKLIQSGGAQDTGLLVGDWATPKIVGVIDPNTIKGNDNGSTSSQSTPPAAVTLNSSTLPSQFIMPNFTLPGGRTFAFGFLAPSSPPNVTIGTPTIDLTSYKVPEFDFVVPNGTLAINKSLTFNFGSTSSIALFDIYANQFSFAPGSTLQADVGTFELEPQTATTLSGFAIVDNAPASSAPAVIGTLITTSFTLPSITFPTGGIDFTSPAALSLINGSSITAPNLPVHLTANSITLNNSSVQGTFVGLNGTTGVNIANHSTLTANGGEFGVLTAAGDIDIAASTLKSTQGALFMGANTGQILLFAAGGAVNLTSGANVTADDALQIFSSKGISLSASSIQGGPFVDLLSATGVSIASKSTLTATGGDLDITTTVGGAITLDNSSAQGGSVNLKGATGVSITGGSSVAATGGNLDLTTTSGGISLSASTLNAVIGPIINDATSGDVLMSATGGTVNISNGSSITAGNLVSLTSDTGVSISGASTLTSGNFLEILADGTLLAPISITGNSTLTSGASSNLILQAGTALTVNGATLNADPVFGSVYMSSDTSSISVQNASITSSLVSMTASSAPGGSITVKNTSITTSSLTLNSGDGILLDGTVGTLTLNGGGSGTATLTDAAGAGGGVLSVNKANFSSFSTVNMAAHTINLTNVAFGGTSAVNLQSNIPMLAASPNTGAVSVPGEVNFITGVTYGGNPAQNFVPTAQGGNYAPSTFPGPIQITAGPY
jgi:hypothetical protein